MELYLILIIVVVLFVTFTAILARYKRCPSDKVLVIYGKTGKDASANASTAVPPSSGPFSRAISFWISHQFRLSVTLQTHCPNRISAWTCPADSPSASLPSRTV